MVLARSKEFLWTLGVSKDIVCFKHSSHDSQEVFSSARKHMRDTEDNGSLLRSTDAHSLFPEMPSARSPYHRPHAQRIKILYIYCMADRRAVMARRCHTGRRLANKERYTRAVLSAAPIEGRHSGSPVSICLLSLLLHPPHACPSPHPNPFGLPLFLLPGASISSIIIPTCPSLLYTCMYV